MEIKDNYPFEDQIVFESKSFVVGQDWEVPIPGFMIAGAKRKAKSILEFNDSERKEFIELIYKTRKGMKEALGLNEVYLFQNEDTEGGFHLWMFPRLAWMEKFGKKIESVRPIMLHAQKNMMKPETIKLVKNNVNLMKKYFERN
ncbi:MAG: diadenosine tetraphosphate hydrolase [archaeon]|jgi:diadenosine tetraphosphate (Ap4A) HIT family hydrolase